MDVELSYFHHSCLLPLATSPPAGQGGDSTGGEDNPLCGCEVAPHSLLHPGEVTWKGDGSFKLRTAQARYQGEHCECNIWSRWPPRSCRSQWVYGPMLTKSFQIKIYLGWLLWGRTNCWGCCNGVNYGPLFLGPDSLLLACRPALKEPGLQTPSQNGLLSTWCLLQIEQSWSAYLQTSCITLMRGFICVLINSN